MKSPLEIKIKRKTKRIKHCEKGIRSIVSSSNKPPPPELRPKPVEHLVLSVNLVPALQLGYGCSTLIPCGYLVASTLSNVSSMVRPLEIKEIAPKISNTGSLPQRTHTDLLPQQTVEKCGELTLYGKYPVREFRVGKYPVGEYPVKRASGVMEKVVVLDASNVTEDLRRTSSTQTSGGDTSTKAQNSSFQFYQRKICNAETQTSTPLHGRKRRTTETQTSVSQRVSRKKRTMETQTNASARVTVRKPRAAAGTQTNVSTRVGVRRSRAAAETQTTGDYILKLAMSHADIRQSDKVSVGLQVSCSILGVIYESFV